MVIVQTERLSFEPSSSFNDKQFSELYVELASFGLTMNQAKIYVYLLSRPASSVRMISKALGLHRVDVYRKLHELEDFGMIEARLNVPRSYSAAPAKTALSAFLHRQEERVQSLKVKSNNLISKLDEYTNSTRDKRSERSAQDSSYLMVVGRRRYYNEIRALVRNARAEVLRIVSPTGIIRTFSSGVYDEYVKAKKRGVSLRMISQINSHNRSYAQRLSKVVDLRHLDDVHLRFLVADKSISVISARFDEKSLSLDSTEDNYLVLKDPKMAESYCFFFEHLWEHASEREIPRHL